MKEDTEALYNQLGKSYEESYLGNPGQAKILDIILQRIPPHSKILDVGSGTGKPMAHTFAQAGHEVHGIDISETMLEIARSQVKGTFQQCKMTDFKPQTTFDVVLGSFSLFHITCDETESMIYRFAEWLKPGGLLMVATILADYYFKDPKLYDASGECVRHYPQPWMNEMYSCTFYTRKGWMDMFEKAGLTFETEVYSPWAGTKDHLEEEHYLVVARKTEKETLFGPYPLPSSYRGPRKFNAAAVLPLTDRLVFDETEDIISLLENNQKVLDTSIWRKASLCHELAKRGSKVYAIYPETNPKAVGKAHEDGVELAQGTLESLPFPHHQFDAVVTTWSLQYADDLEKSLHEIARVVNPSNHKSRIIISQGGPDNKVLNLLNKALVHIGRDGSLDHHGYILRKASEIFAGHGFADVSLHRVEAYCKFPEQENSESCARAAEVLAGLWFTDDPDYEKIKQALVPELEQHFQDSPHSIGFGTAVLVAKPAKS
ncbi:uncharacterized protein KD926_004457 [Aspergillus affinis]|uniref:uncharacterized protein n=1 Tax=Aspergillus affinis TaxID=1070780 RepID=UPI0022FE6866|nr:uncharacterized protein KD926_004457 [Aspergillus affinis]KAI9035162.1 hypothetical protein KD926_004457 [Aspergillus affinis]